MKDCSPAVLIYDLDKSEPVSMSSSSSSLNNDNYKIDDILNLNSKWPSVLYLPSLYPSLYEPSTYFSQKNVFNDSNNNSEFIKNLSLINKLMMNQNYLDSYFYYNSSNSPSLSSCSSFSSVSSSLIDLNLNDELQQLSNIQSSSDSNYDKDFEINQKINELINNNNSSLNKFKDGPCTINCEDELLNCDEASMNYKNSCQDNKLIKTSSPRQQNQKYLKFVAPRFERKWLENNNTSCRNKINQTSSELNDKNTKPKKSMESNNNSNNVSYSHVLANLNNNNNNNNNYSNRMKTKEGSPNSATSSNQKLNYSSTKRSPSSFNNENNYSNRFISNKQRKIQSNYPVNNKFKINNKKTNFANNQKFNCKCGFSSFSVNCSSCNHFGSTSSSSSSLSSSPTAKNSTYLNQNYQHNHNSSNYHNQNSDNGYQYNKYQSNSSSRCRA